MPEQYLPNLYQILDSEYSIPERLSVILHQSCENQIRHMDFMTASAALIIEIPRVVADYGVTEEIQRQTQTEAIRLIFSKFGMLGVNEIREAYRAWSVGEFKVTGAEPYGGTFNAAQMGKILGGYTRNRKETYQKYLKARTALEKRIEDLNHHENSKTRFDKTFKSDILKQRINIHKWQDVPFWWYSFCAERGWITFKKGEGAAILEEAKQLASAEMERLENEKKKAGFSARLVINIPDLEELAKRIARQISLFRKIVNSDHWINF